MTQKLYGTWGQQSMVHRLHTMLCGDGRPPIVWAACHNVGNSAGKCRVTSATKATCPACLRWEARQEAGIAAGAHSHRVVALPWHENGKFGYMAVCDPHGIVGTKMWQRANSPGIEKEIASHKAIPGHMRRKDREQGRTASRVARRAGVR